VALPHVRMPALHLVQVFQNLIGNAVKYRKPDQSPKIHASAEARDGAWVLSVAHNGNGIDPRYREQISLCKKLIERSGGTIWVKSAGGNGSPFCFTVRDQRR
jgi:light-regulated signal transduction histidine kinase (bacteriophytochrome)